MRWAWGTLNSSDFSMINIGVSTAMRQRLIRSLTLDHARRLQRFSLRACIGSEIRQRTSPEPYCSKPC